MYTIDTVALVRMLNSWDSQRKHQLELAKLYEEPYDSGPEPVEDHEELIEHTKKTPRS